MNKLFHDRSGPGPASSAATSSTSKTDVVGNSKVQDKNAGKVGANKKIVTNTVSGNKKLGPSSNQELANKTSSKPTVNRSNSSTR